MGVRTDTDDTAARASARDMWVSSTRHYFVEGCAHWRTQPEYAVTKIRPIVEGFVHIVCVVRDSTFETHERRELRRVPLEKAIPTVKQYLSAEQVHLVGTLKTFGNAFHHNQGVVQRPKPNTVRGALLQCADLLAWLDREVLRDAPPQDYLDALLDVQGSSPVATPLPPAAATAARTPHPPAAASVERTLLPPAPRPSTKKRGLRERWLLVGALSLGLLAVLVTLGVVLASGGAATPGASASPELGWVRAYSDAIASRDADRIVAIHALPSGRFFMMQNQTGPQLRAAYDGWFRKDGKGRTTTFHDCKLVNVTADGSRAVRCEAHIDPPLESGVGVISTCLVFRADGRLVSRTESKYPPAACPPPPL